MHQIKPQISFLNPGNISDIHQASLKILHQKGVRIHSKKMEQVLKKEPGIIIEHDIIKFQPEVVDSAIQSTPSNIGIYDRTGEFRFNIGAGNETRFGIGVTNLWYEDPESGEFLKFSRELIAQSTLLGHNLDGYDIISTPGIIRDAYSGQEDLYCTLEMIANTTKPLILLVSDRKQFNNVVDISKHLIGNLEEKPSIIPYFNPKTPLVYDEGTIENIITSIHHGLPVIISNYGMMGSTTPVDPFKTLVLLNAELLAGLSICQIIKRGTPVILGSLPAVFDMKSMVSYYDPQSMLVNLASADMMEHYQIPHAGTSGSGNGWRADIKGAGMLWMNHLTSMLGKTGLVPFVGGNLDSLVFSPTMVVYSNYIIRQVKEFGQGFFSSDQDKILKEINQADIGGNFFTSSETLEKMVEAPMNNNHGPWKNLSFDIWKQFGEPDAYDLMREYTVEVLKKAIRPKDHDELMGKGVEFIGSQV